MPKTINHAHGYAALLHTMLVIVVILNILNFAIIIYTEPTNINIMWNKFTNNFFME